MPSDVSFFKQTKSVNLDLDPNVQTTNEISYRPSEGWSHSSETEVNAVHIGADVRQETVKMEAIGDTGSVTLAGPSAGVDVGFKSNLNGSNISAMAELSAARVEGALNVTKNVAAYGSANLNANTGVKVGSDGLEFNVLGFGLTLGVGGKWTANTPLGSVGGCNAITITNTRENERTHENVYTN